MQHCAKKIRCQTVMLYSLIWVWPVKNSKWRIGYIFVFCGGEICSHFPQHDARARCSTFVR